MPLETSLVGLQLSLCFTHFSFFLSFLLVPAQMSVCIAVEKTTRAKLPRPCLDLNARPGTLRPPMLTATFLPSKSVTLGKKSNVYAFGAFHVIPVFLHSLRREHVWCFGISEFASSHVTTRAEAGTLVSQTVVQEECQSLGWWVRHGAPRALGARICYDQHPG